MDSEEEIRARAFSFFVASGGMDLADRLIALEEHSEEQRTQGARLQEQLDGIVQQMKMRIAALEALAQDQSAMLDECHQTIYDEYGAGVDILHRIDGIRTKASVLLQKKGG